MRHAKVYLFVGIPTHPIGEPHLKSPEALRQARSIRLPADSPFGIAIKLRIYRDKWKDPSSRSKHLPNSLAVEVREASAPRQLIFDESRGVLICLLFWVSVPFSALILSIPVLLCILHTKEPIITASHREIIS